MADKKISQLTAASTPLAGTEVLPIVQSGTTKQVSVANLTVGRATTLGSASLVYQTGTAGNNYVEGEFKVGGVNSSVGAQLAYAAQSSGYVSLVNLNNSGGANARIYFGYGATTSGVPANPVAYFTQDGNLIPTTAAKGVNFTANTGAAGMTSQLLNWYEEGTWTPTQGAGLTVVGTFSSSGTYTRVGRLVTIFGTLNGSTSIAAASGGVITSGYPFTLGSAAAGAATTSNLAGCVTYLGSGGSSNMYADAALASAGAIIVTASYYV